MDVGIGGRVALVTGGSQGIGLAIATALHTAGARVALLARHEDQLDAAVTALGGDEGTVLPISADVADAESVRAAVAQAHAWHDRLDIVVNCAGASFVPHSIVETPASALQENLDTKLIGTYRVSVEALPFLPTDGTGRIITIGGVTGRTVTPNAVVSGVTNAAVIAFTSYLASEAAQRNVLVNCLSPGLTYTEGWVQKLAATGAAQGKSPEEVKAGMAAGTAVRLGRWSEPTEVGNAALFLASDLSSYVTGRVLDVDGGIYKAVV